MKIALATRKGQLAPLFPGVEILIFKKQSAAAELEKRIQTSEWPPLAWGLNLMREDVNLLICSGLDHFVWGSLQGYGISVAPDAAGTVDEVLNLWYQGQLIIPEAWPPVGGVCGKRGGGRRARWRGGRRQKWT